MGFGDAGVWTALSNGDGTFGSAMFVLASFGADQGWDPAKHLRVLANVNQKLERQGGVSDTLNWDPKRELVWNLNSYKDIYVIKFDPKTLEMSEDPAK